MIPTQYKNEKDISTLNDALADISYIDGYTPSQNDVVIFNALGKAPPTKLAHALRWYNHIKSFGDDKKKFAASKKALAGGAPAPASKADDDDDVDLFGSDEEDEEAERVKQQRLKEYADKKSKKPALIAKSSIVLDVKPWDDETDMKELEKQVRTVEMEGLVWGASKLVPVGYGIQKLQIMCVVEDEKVSVDLLTETIQEFEDFVQSVDIAAFNKI
ncbi:elongation factor 1-beta'-like [Neocloeon triangulifer]|uniref:elongation factor 1-beta'-like n=1 Tax=Neocloeon triangulifer TaxID=2078957 RepID=UPI00286F6E3E|nr:elongation factor 1-beta'-like [Neocloeon triangulifer]XP_059472414.1 elongation factor 1-beta'-like [Neocloeon triangulifer]